jgi:hypothetical protein
MDREAIQEQKRAKPMHLPALSDSLDEAEFSKAPSLPRSEAARRANRCADQLQRDPNNVESREEFARLLAEDLGKVDAAAEQIELLLKMPNQRDDKCAEWIALLAAWQLRHRKDDEAGKALLERLISEFPRSPQAFAAQRRLNLMELESRLRQRRREASPAQDPAPIEARSKFKIRPNIRW